MILYNDMICLGIAPQIRYVHTNMSKNKRQAYAVGHKARLYDLIMPSNFNIA